MRWLSNLLRRLLADLQSEQQPIVAKGTGIIPHRPEVSYRDEQEEKRSNG